MLAPAETGPSILGSAEGKETGRKGQEESTMMYIPISEVDDMIPANKMPLRRRVADAWAVLIGKAHAVKFGK